MAARHRKTSVLTARKLSVDVSRKLSAISMASDAQLAGLCGRVGLDQAELRQTVKNILEVDSSELWEAGSEDGEWEEEEEGWETDNEIWQTINLARKQSSESQVGELRTVLGLYRRHRVSVTSIISGDKSER